MEKLIPYSVYLPQASINRLKELSKNRRASLFVRDALLMADEKGDKFISGYNKGIRDACQVIKDSKEAYILLIGNTRLGDILTEQIGMLEQNGK